MKLIFIPHAAGHFPDGQVCCLQQVGGFDQPVLDQKLLGRLPGGALEELSEVPPVNAQGRGDVLNGKIPGVVLFDEGDGFLDVVICHPGGFPGLPPACGFHQGTQKQIQVADEVQCRFFHVGDHVEHFLLHHLPLLRGMTAVYRVVHGHQCPVQGFFHLQAVKLDPAVGPGVPGVGDIGGNLSGIQQESLSGGNLKCVGHFADAGSHQSAPAFQDIVEQIMVACGGTEDVARFAFFASTLIHVQINVIFVAKN